MATTATNHWKLGLFVVLGVGVMLGALFWLGARRFRRESFAAVSYFDESVQGLDVGSPVKFRGVTVGTVADITIAPDHRHVQVTSNIYVDALVRLSLRTHAPTSEEEFIDPRLRVQLASAGITGVRFIQTDFFDPERYPPPHLPFEPPWNYVPSAPSTLKNIEIGAEQHEQTGCLKVVPVHGPMQRGGAVSLCGCHIGTRAQQERDSGRVLFLSSIDDAKVGATTASVRNSAASVEQAAAGVSDAREELQTSLVALREALESVRTLADSLERDPSVLLRGPHGDGTARTNSR